MVDCEERRLQTRLSDERKEEVNYGCRISIGEERVERVDDDEGS